MAKLKILENIEATTGWLSSGLSGANSVSLDGEFMFLCILTASSSSSSSGYLADLSMTAAAGSSTTADAPQKLIIRETATDNPALAAGALLSSGPAVS